MRRISVFRSKVRMTATAVATAGAVAAFVALGAVGGATGAQEPCPPSPQVPHFVDPVAQPPLAQQDRAGHYTLTAAMGRHSFSSAWPAVPSLGYSTDPGILSTPEVKRDLYLGPTIATRRGTPIAVDLVNGLPDASRQLFPFDPRSADLGFDGNMTTLHRHGGLQAARHDGVPGQEVPPGGTRRFVYPNDQAAAPLWYHDHADNVTSYRVYEGLAGFMPNTDIIETAVISRQIPSGAFSKAYVLQDKSFTAQGELCYSRGLEFFGDTPVVNGTVAPFQAVQPRRYTFTFINGSDSAFYHLDLEQRGAQTAAAQPTLTVVGSDEGYLLRPVPVDDLVIAPGERYTLVADFTGHVGEEWILTNDANAPFPDGDPTAVPELMSFRVDAPLSGTDRSFVPSVIPETNNIVPASLMLLRARLRTLQAGEISMTMDDGTEMTFAQLGDRANLLDFMADPATETPQLGSTETWAVRNHSPDAHPLHEHMVEMRLVGRWHVGAWVDVPGTRGGRVPDPATIGPFEPAGAWESGPKDTFVVPNDYITAWVGTYTIAGKTVWHCHILTHEDMFMHNMMRPLVIGTARQTQLPTSLSLARLDTLIRQP